MKNISAQLAKGFTLIETLVAVAILMVAIAGPLNIAEKGLITAVSSRDETVASYLAQDLLEYVKSVRDDNVSNKRFWLTSLSGCTASSPCIAETTGSANAPTSINNESLCVFSGNPVVLSNECKLYIQEGGSVKGYYTYVPSGNQATQFYRSFSISPLDSSANSSSNIGLLTVSVYWPNGNILNQVVLQTEIFNTSR